MVSAVCAAHRADLPLRAVPPRPDLPRLVIVSYGRGVARRQGGLGRSHHVLIAVGLDFGLRCRNQIGPETTSERIYRVPRRSAATSRAGLSPTEESFALVCRHARLNVRDALDLIAVHAEKAVSGAQPRAALNPAIVVAAVSSWERFVADLVGALTPLDTPASDDIAMPEPATGWPPGTFAGDSSHHPGAVGGRLRNLGYLNRPDVVARWVADVPTGWRGVRPAGWLRLGPGTEETWGVDDYLASAILVRNAGAHRSAAALASVAERRNLPFLDSDAKSTTIQHGYARGVVALVIQVLDSTITAISEDRGWSGDHRLPDEWFLGKPQPTGRHRGIDFWVRALPRAAE